MRNRNSETLKLVRSCRRLRVNFKYGNTVFFSIFVYDIHKLCILNALTYIHKYTHITTKCHSKKYEIWIVIVERSFQFNSVDKSFQYFCGSFIHYRTSYTYTRKLNRFEKGKV